jgi:hypothetical protein
MAVMLGSVAFSGDSTVRFYPLDVVQRDPRQGRTIAKPSRSLAVAFTPVGSG